MRLRIAALAIAALGGVALISTAVSAMPNGIPKANEVAGQASNIQQARWVWVGGRRVWRAGPRVVVRRPGFGVAIGTRPFWGPGWGNSYAWNTGPAWGVGPAWGPRPVWGGAYAWNRPVWGARPGWGWNTGWNNPGWNSDPAAGTRRQAAVRRSSESQG